MERRLVAAARFDMPVERVEARVAARVGKPAPVDAGVRIEDLLRRPRPRNLACGLGPKGLRIGAPLVIGLPVAAHSFRSLTPDRLFRAGLLLRRERPNATAGR